MNPGARIHGMLVSQRRPVPKGLFDEPPLCGASTSRVGSWEWKIVPPTLAERLPRYAFPGPQRTRIHDGVSWILVGLQKSLTSTVLC